MKKNEQIIFSMPNYLNRPGPLILFLVFLVFITFRSFRKGEEELGEPATKISCFLRKISKESCAFQDEVWSCSGKRYYNYTRSDI